MSKQERDKKFQNCNGSSESRDLTASGGGIDIIKLYRQEMSRSPLLTKEGEVDLAQAIERGRKAQKELLRSSQDDDNRARLEEDVRRGEAARKKFLEEGI